MTSAELVEEIKRVREAAIAREMELINRLRRHTPMGQIASLLNVDRKTLYNRIKKYDDQQRQQRAGAR